jgi:SAM-dependent methyltransferase
VYGFCQRPQATNSWDKIYSEELTNFDETGDEGEVWFAIFHASSVTDLKLMATRFGDTSVEKMVDWSLEHVPPSLNPAVLEVGSGNGALLFALAEAGYSQKLLAGIDYSSDAVKLSTSISETRNVTEITFSVCDFLQEDPCLLSGLERNRPPSRWDLILDKGTYDAIALGQKDASGRSPVAGYPHQLCRLLKPGGLFLITCTNIAVNILRTF